MAYSAVLGLIWRRSGYGGGVSNLVCGRGGGLLLGGGCRSFSSVESVSGGRMLPWLMLPPASEDGSMVYKFFSLAEKRVLSFNWSHGTENCSGFDPNDKYVQLVGSTNGWLGLVNNRTNQMDLINPLTRRHVKLPSLDHFVDSASQIILSCSPDEEGECRALIVYDKAGELAFCCPGRSNAEWRRIGNYNDFCYQSFAYSRRQKLFFCANCEELQAWDLGDPLSRKLMTRMNLSFEREGDRPRVLLGSNEDIDCLCHYYSLVVNEDTDDLFVVRLFVKHCEEGVDYFKIITLDVHRYDPESGTLRYMDRSLDGLSFFIGTNMNGFALEFPELKRNSIYFVLNNEYDPSFEGHRVGVFSYEDATVSPLCDVHVLSGFNKTISPALSWFTPNTSN